MKSLELKNVSVSFNKDPIIKNVSLTLGEGEIGCLLGPSGCGKTTLLRVIAGFQAPTAGQVLVDDQVFSDEQQVMAPEQRNIGMVFQDFALFPHLTVAQNIGFGLRRWTKKHRAGRIAELLELIGLVDLADAYSHQLSGGQQQRVALARALAPKPHLLLMDEPFSSMDTELREQLAREVRDILKLEKTSAVLVTHDQFEAFAMADSICVLRDGTIQQQASGYELYHKPATPFVANFIGEGVIIDGEVISSSEVKTELGYILGDICGDFHVGCPVQVLVRPDDVIHDDEAKELAEIRSKAFRGSEFLYKLRMASGVEVLCLAPSHHNHSIHSKIGVRLDIDHLVLFKREG